MRYTTHVFLGPTLEKKTAQRYLPEAYYHPPIQCGDLLRLLRLNPKHIVIIDGLYEQVPAVWHKEILLALDRGISVYGAASMGALRAAELHQYGMVGLGIIFQAFATQQLNDDDEVAVLHQSAALNYAPLNDAMVTIRATLTAACAQGVINPRLEKELSDWCKAQFYPQRSLQRAIASMPKEWHKECLKLNEWLAHHGLVDVKRQDAISALAYVKAQQIKDAGVLKVGKTAQTPYTKFIASLVDDVAATPFTDSLPWLPEQEQYLHHLAAQKKQDYQLIMELTGLIKNALTLINEDELIHDKEVYLEYIKTHDLYYPKQLHCFFAQRPRYASLSLWLLHTICLANVTWAQIEKTLPSAAFYFAAPDILLHEASLLSWIVLFIYLLYQPINDGRLVIKKSIFEQHLEEIHFWPRVKNHKSLGVDTKTTLEFIVTYMSVIYVYHGVKDVKPGVAKAPDFYDWVYDVLALYAQVVEVPLHAC